MIYAKAQDFVNDCEMHAPDRKCPGLRRHTGAISHCVVQSWPMAVCGIRSQPAAEYRYGNIRIAWGRSKDDGGYDPDVDHVATWHVAEGSEV